MGMREKLIKLIQYIVIPYWAEQIADHLIANGVTIQVHGRWEKYTPGYLICSRCKEHVAIFSGHKNYCPNCGVKMDLKVEA